MKRDKLDQFALSGQMPHTQYAALCWRMHRRGVEVLLITSRDTGRWVLPKGWPMAERSAPEAAATEAWEEAGVKGEVGKAPLGFFTYDKAQAPLPCLSCAVAVFPLRVASLASKFPERKERRRKWFTAERAARKVAEPELRALLLSLSEDPDLVLAPVALAQD